MPAPVFSLPSVVSPFYSQNFLILRIPSDDAKYLFDYYLTFQDDRCHSQLERFLGHHSSLSVVCNLGREPVVEEAGLCGGGSCVVIIIRVGTVSLNSASIIL